MNDPETIEDLLALLAKRKVLVSAVIQFGVNDWNVRLRPDGKFTTAQANGRTLFAAMKKAWSNYVDTDAFDTETPMNPKKKKLVKRVRL